MGAISIPLNPAYSGPELRYLIKDSQSRLLVMAGGTNTASDPARSFSGLGARVIHANPHETVRPDKPDETDFNSAEPGEDDIALMLYTSGTTGRPKGACITHASATANMDMLNAAWEWTSDDVLVHTLPLFHLHGLLVALHGALHAGATCVMHTSFDAKSTIQDLSVETNSVFMAVPTMYRRILTALDGRTLDLSHMRLMTSGSDRLPVEAFTAIERQLGHRVVERYGMTETGIMLSNPVGGERIAGQVGVPLPGVAMRIVDPATGRERDTGVVGELQTRGRHLFAGYWRDPAKTEASFTGNGWFRTGDLGRIDSRGRFELKGRMDDTIITGGFNVYPTEVEHVLARHAEVDQCAVVGVPDPEWGEAVTACVVRISSAAKESDLVRHCRSSLAGYKTPKRIAFMDSLPRNAMGKIKRDELVRILAARPKA